MWAHVLNGAIFEMTNIDPEGRFHADLIWVDIAGITPAPQIGWTAQQVEGAWTFAAPVPPTLTLIQQAVKALNAGVALTSASTPALNGTYACDASAQGKISMTDLYIVKNGTFYNEATNYNWVDIAGVAHTFPNIAAFDAFATQIANYIAAVYAVLDGQSATLPPAAIAIP